VYAEPVTGNLALSLEQQTAGWGQPGPVGGPSRSATRRGLYVGLGVFRDLAGSLWSRPTKPPWTCASATIRTSAQTLVRGDISCAAGFRRVLRGGRRRWELLRLHASYRDKLRPRSCRLPRSVAELCHLPGPPEDRPAAAKRTCCGSPISPTSLA